ncbi:hypothetical protein RHSIM_Rhsim01G0005000 [Rhododendron simsii]|uniref:SET domain-containing protein n=1 Tax=Rhododendron simsii TaxID=118357 RepID=A0A834M2C8_RHOSS|nr:hypothetical protein RHSIM_Rhsim01G0005000 [Rhododendron simsii]
MEDDKKILEDKGFNLQGQVVFENYSGPDWTNKTMDILLQRARIMCSDEVELYFAGVDVTSVHLYNPRIELEALHTILSFLDKALCSGYHTINGILHALRELSIKMIQELGDKIRLETIIVTNYSCDKERHLLQWGKSKGVRSKLEVAYVEGAGRGAIATEDLKVGDIALEIPVSAIISEELVHESDMFPILEKIDGISLETMMLLWSMKEKHNPDSKFKLYFDALPEVFNTGLSFGVNAIMALDGTLLLEETVQAKEHLRTQYDELFPALCNDHPGIFPTELYTWDQFLWACELWYSNGMKVMFTNGKLQTCLVPIAGFLNHSLCPHILHYGKVDSATNSLRFPLSRPCNAGEQCYLSYGKFSSSHLVTFYGFLPQGENPYDVMPLGNSLALLPFLHMHLCKSEGLDNLDFCSRHVEVGDSLQNTPNIMACVQLGLAFRENFETELEILEALRSTFEDMLETLGETDLDDRSTSWDVKLAVKFKDQQRRIVSSIVTSCYYGCKLLEDELLKK